MQDYRGIEVIDWRWLAKGVFQHIKGKDINENDSKHIKTRTSAGHYYFLFDNKAIGHHIR